MFVVYMGFGGSRGESSQVKSSRGVCGYARVFRHQVEQSRVE